MNYTCSKGYLFVNSVDDNAHRPKLQWDHVKPDSLGINFTIADGTDNMGIYFGSGTDAFNRATSYDGVSGVKVGLKPINSTGPNDRYPRACISARYVLLVANLSYSVLF